MKYYCLTYLCFCSILMLAQKKDIKKDTVGANIAVPNAIGTGYSLDITSSQRPRHLFNINYQRITKYGTMLATLQYADRFTQTDGEFNIELYPRLGKKTYAYAGFAIGFNTNLFPTNRYGLELFHTFPKAFEGSIGLRQFNFSNGDVTLYTASLGKYYKNYWFNVRAYLTPTDNNNTSLSLLSRFRRYFKNGNHYLGGAIGFGRGIAEIGLNEYFTANSFRLMIEWQQPLKKGFFLNPQIDFRRDEKTFDPGNYFNFLILSISAKHTF